MANIVLAPEDIGTIDNKEKPKVVSTLYTYSTKIEEYDDRSRNAIIYPGIEYANSSGSTIREVPSLKTCEFCNHIKLTKNEDKLYPMDILDYNYTHILQCAKPSNSKLNQWIPLEVYEKKNHSVKHYQTNIRFTSLDEQNCAWLPFGFDKELHYGETSTTITIDAESGDGYIAYLQSGTDQSAWDTAHDATNGTNLDYTSGTSTIGTLCYTFSSQTVIYREFLAFNTSQIPDNNTIDAAYIHFKGTTAQNSDNDGDDFLVVVDGSQASHSSLVLADYDNCGATNNPTEYSDRIDITGLGLAWRKFILDSDGIGNIDKTDISKFAIREGHDVLDSPLVCGAVNSNLFTFANTELGSGYIPYINITYSEPVAGECDCTTPSVDTEWEINMSCHCNLTSDWYGNITFVDTGYTNCSANINTSNDWTLINNQILYIATDCKWKKK